VGAAEAAGAGGAGAEMAAAGRAEVAAAGAVESVGGAGPAAGVHAATGVPSMTNVTNTLMRSHPGESSGSIVGDAQVSFNVRVAADSALSYKQDVAKIRELTRMRASDYRSSGDK